MFKKMMGWTMEGPVYRPVIHSFMNRVLWMILGLIVIELILAIALGITMGFAHPVVRGITKSGDVLVQFWYSVAILGALVYLELLFGWPVSPMAIKYFGMNAYEIHVGNHAASKRYRNEGESVAECYLRLVKDRINAVLKRGGTAYIVAHSKREVNLVKSIPGVVVEEADKGLRYRHLYDVSKYKVCNLPIIGINLSGLMKRKRKAWYESRDYIVYRFKIESSHEAITYLENLSVADFMAV